MIRDTGIASFFRKTDNTEPGGKPSYTWLLIHQSWYGEKSFETSPQHPTESRREQRTDNRIQITQCRLLKENDDVCVLRQIFTWSDVTSDDIIYRVGRCYHGSDGPDLYSDVNLEVTRP